MIELYCDWRTNCAEVQAAYERFSIAPASDRGVAFAAYVAALDREHSACDAYAAQIRLITSRCAEHPGLLVHRRGIDCALQQASTDPGEKDL